MVMCIHMDSSARVHNRTGVAICWGWLSTFLDGRGDFGMALPNVQSWLGFFFGCLARTSRPIADRQARKMMAYATRQTMW